ncbi:hypothetical protein FB45DRAFT_874074 [Roridomyces roridus]|uniref:Uncharacterized protein n=1 Tax=Roridomyces roridus TaxID=1738132 RepID=A0AAD7BAC8_9AGAR|nr:hypothetical protein FB45DRAFT_874074 [Roridomyces roridus]
MENQLARANASQVASVWVPSRKDSEGATSSDIVERKLPIVVRMEVGGKKAAGKKIRNAGARLAKFEIHLSALNRAWISAERSANLRENRRIDGNHMSESTRLPESSACPALAPRPPPPSRVTCTFSSWGLKYFSHDRRKAQELPPLNILEYRLAFLAGCTTFSEKNLEHPAQLNLRSPDGQWSRFGPNLIGRCLSGFGLVKTMEDCPAVIISNSGSSSP